MMIRCACLQSIAAKSKVPHATSQAGSKGSMITAGIMLAIAFYDLVLSICKFIIQLRTKCIIEWVIRSLGSFGFREGLGLFCWDCFILHY